MAVYPSFGDLHLALIYIRMGDYGFYIAHTDLVCLVFLS